MNHSMIFLLILGGRMAPMYEPLMVDLISDSGELIAAVHADTEHISTDWIIL